MTAKIKENILTVTTDIPASVVEAGSDLTARDEKGNPLYAVKISADGKGNLSQYGLSANSIVDGKLAVVIVEEMDFKFDDFKKRYGKAVIAANKYCPIIAAAAATEQEMLDAAFTQD